jgi:aquaporin Z
MNLAHRLTAEFIGTMVLVFGGCGAGVISAGFPGLGIGFLGVALAFGLTVLGGIYAFGHISGGHFNPAVSIGAATAGRFAWKDVPLYILVQVVGAIAGASLLWLVAQGQPGFSTGGAGGFATNGYGLLSPGLYPLASVALVEVILTFIFVSVILGATDSRAVSGFAGIAIGLTLTLALLVAIPVSNASLNPARSTGPALFATQAIPQLWVFWVAPIVGALIAGGLYRFLFGRADELARPVATPTVPVPEPGV